MNGRRRTYRTSRILGEEAVVAEFHRRCGRRGGAHSLAEKAGVSEAMVSRIRSGCSPLTPGIAAALGYRLAYVKDDPPAPS